jgi:hypothetical protein
VHRLAIRSRIIGKNLGIAAFQGLDVPTVRSVNDLRRINMRSATKMKTS